MSAQRYDAPKYVPEHPLINFSLQVYLPIASPLGQPTPPLGQNDDLDAVRSTSNPMTEAMNKLAGVEGALDLTARDFISLYALSVVLSSLPTESRSASNYVSTMRQAVAVMVHLAALRQCGLAQRSFAKQKPAGSLSTNTQFLTSFFDAARDSLSSLPEGCFPDLPWDAFDLFDGRLYINVSVSTAAMQ